MSNAKVVMGQAANTLVKPLEVEDVFSTYLYTGDSSTQTITNGIDLDGEGGLVWGKRRNSTQDHFFFDTERGIYNYIESNTANAQRNDGNAGVVAFNTNGFDIKSYSGQFNLSGGPYTSWTWRKAPKFFDCVQYTGDGVAGREIAHSLDANVGFMIVKRVDDINNWIAWHRLATSGSSSGSLLFNSTGATYASTTTQYYFGDGSTTIDPTSSVFTVGSNAVVNASGGTYIAYLFAHNNGDGEFGPDGDADIIKCGGYTGTGVADNTIDIGFEPQWLLVKRADGTAGWDLFDNMRGIVSGSGGTDARLYANATTSENTGVDYLELTPTGINLRSSNTETNGSGGTYIYIAIRRGTKVPESATEVFDVGDASETGSTAPEYEGGFTVDMAIKRIMSASQPNYIFDRLRGGQSLRTDTTAAESAFSAAKFDYMDGYYNGTSSSSTNWSAMWKRAPGFFDVVAYTGDGVAGRTVSHNLGVAPEMIISKKRSGTQVWGVGVPSINSGQGYLKLNEADPLSAAPYTVWSNITATSYAVNADDLTNASGGTYINYLFASLPGISKVGSYTGSASAQTIDCGFTSGARFVLIKRTDSTGSWIVWDTNRGIVAGSEPFFELDTTDAPSTNDYIDPHNSGFTVAGNVGFVNTAGGSYIFYAIA